MGIYIYSVWKCNDTEGKTIADFICKHVHVRQYNSGAHLWRGQGILGDARTIRYMESEHIVSICEGKLRYARSGISDRKGVHTQGLKCRRLCDGR